MDSDVDSCYREVFLRECQYALLHTFVQHVFLAVVRNSFAHFFFFFLSTFLIKDKSVYSIFVSSILSFHNLNMADSSDSKPQSQSTQQVNTASKQETKGSSQAKPKFNASDFEPQSSSEYGFREDGFRKPLHNFKPGNLMFKEHTPTGAHTPPLWLETFVAFIRLCIAYLR